MILSVFLLVVRTIFNWAVCLKRYGAGEQPDVRIGNMNSSSCDLPVANSPTPTTGAAGHGAERPYGRIDQNYDTLDQVKEALQEVGLESSNLIIGVDFTKSNEWTGKHCFNGRSLHHIGNSPNPYEQAISIIGETLLAFDEDNIIPCFGFGDMSTHDQNVFNFYRDGRACIGVPEVLQRYREIAPHVRLSGPTSLAPIIETATRIVQDSGNQYHILLIIADGQVPRSTGAHCASYSEEIRSENYLEERTLQALIHASRFPLSVVLVGVGDGPWDDLMHCHDDRRLFDNFQFVDFTKIMSREMPKEKEEQFALEALMKIPTQYATIISQRISDEVARAPTRAPVPPPLPQLLLAQAEGAVSVWHMRNKERGRTHYNKEKPREKRRTEARELAQASANAELSDRSNGGETDELSKKRRPGLSP